METQREFEFTDRHFQHLRALVFEHTGISLSDAKRDLVYGRLARRLRVLELPSFDAYCDLLRDERGEELEGFTNAVTTNLTAFFREPHHFEILAGAALPAPTRGPGRRVRIWSAGCSTGEEPYSIAMVVAESIPVRDGRDARILATDIDSGVLEAGRSGTYAESRVEGLSHTRKRRWFRRGRGGNEGRVRVVPELRGMVTFRRLNLMQAWPMRGPFDAIFCRNVFIYFDKPVQRRLVGRFADLLPVGGHLFLGHSESLFNVSDRFRLTGMSTYVKDR